MNADQTLPSFVPGTLPAAIAATGELAGSDAHYGNPLREQKKLKSARAFVLLGHRAAVRVRGEDRLSWLHSLTSQDLLSLQPGQSRHALFLTAQGRIDIEVGVYAGEDSVDLVTDRSDAGRLTDFLERMKFMLRVQVSSLESTHTLLGFSQPSVQTRELLKQSGQPDPDSLPVYEDPWPRIGEGGYSYATQEAQGVMDEAGYAWSEVILPSEDLPDTLERLQAAGVEPAGVMAAEALRIAALRPTRRLDAEETTIPHELDLLRTAVHLNKGCYKGQETIARVHNLGRPPKRLVFLHLDGSGHDLPSPGCEIFVAGEEDGRSVGKLHSVALHLEAGPIALALVKRTLDTSLPLTVVEDQERYPAVQTPILSPDAGSIVGRSQTIRRLP